MEPRCADDDPFADPTLVEDQLTFVGQSTLNVGRNASLTLGTDSLIVLGDSSHQKQQERLADFVKMKASESNRASSAVASSQRVSPFNS
jgi:hypothetical protein